MTSSHTMIQLLGKVSGYEISFKLSELKDSKEEITERLVIDIINSVLNANRLEYKDAFPMDPTSNEYRLYLKVIGDTLDSTGWTLRLRKPSRVPAHV